MDVILSSASGVGPDARYVALALLHREGPKGCFPSLDTLQADTGLRRPRIVTAIKALESATGRVRLQVDRRWRKDGQGKAPNEYHLTVDLSSDGRTNGLVRTGEPMPPVSTEDSAKPSGKPSHSSLWGGPKFGNGGFHSSDAVTGSHSGISLTKNTHGETRSALPDPSKGDSPEEERAETGLDERTGVANRARLNGLVKSITPTTQRKTKEQEEEERQKERERRKQEFRDYCAIEEAKEEDPEREAKRLARRPCGPPPTPEQLEAARIQFGGQK